MKGRSTIDAGVIREMKSDQRMPTILIVDDEAPVRNLLHEFLHLANTCTTACSAEEALTLLKTMTFDLVISDISMGGISGLELVPRLLEQTPDAVVVMISGQSTIDFAIEALRVGAFDYITKPFDLRHVDAAVRRALAHATSLYDSTETPFTPRATIWPMDKSRPTSS